MESIPRVAAEERQAEDGVSPHLHGMAYLEGAQIFEGIAAMPARVLALVKLDVKLRSLACGG